jgi:hypothetical protein
MPMYMNRSNAKNVDKGTENNVQGRQQIYNVKSGGKVDSHDKSFHTTADSHNSTKKATNIKDNSSKKSVGEVNGANTGIIFVRRHLRLQLAHVPLHTVSLGVGTLHQEHLSS